MSTTPIAAIATRATMMMYRTEQVERTKIFGIYGGRIWQNEEEKMRFPHPGRTRQLTAMPGSREHSLGARFHHPGGKTLSRGIQTPREKKESVVALLSSLSEKSDQFLAWREPIEKRYVRNLFEMFDEEAALHISEKDNSMTIAEARYMAPGRDPTGDHGPRERPATNA